MLNIHTMEYYSPITKNEIMLFAAIRMELESLILSEANQTKDKHLMILLVCAIKTKQNQNDTNEHELTVTSGERWKGGIVREFGTDMYTLLYFKWMGTSLVVQRLKTSHSPCRGPWFNPWSGNCPHATLKDPACCNKDQRRHRRMDICV